MSAENLKVKVTNVENNSVGKPWGLSEREVAARRSVNLRPPTLQSVLGLIDSMVELDEGVREEVKRVARSYPNQAYPQFVKNLQNIVNRILAARRESMRPYSVKRDLNECGEKSDNPKEGTQKGHHPLPKAPKNIGF